jgi:catechol 2,3-dioxygenase-like lactoylglutathione lyase family enzyme
MNQPQPVPSPPRLSGIAQVSMRAHDLPRAIAFYRDVLGLSLLSAFDDMAFMLAGSVRIMLAQPRSPDQDHPGSILYFDSRNIEGDCATLEALGVVFERRPFVVHSEDNHEFRLAFFRDTEGNTLALSQWRRSSV